MKKLYLLSLCLMPFLILAQVPSKGLVGYWPFTGNANDVSGNNLNAKVYGATLTTDRAGNPNAAYSFNGFSNYMVVKDTSLLTLPAFTLAAWVYFPYSNGNTLQEILIKGPIPYNYGFNLNTNDLPAAFYNPNGVYSGFQSRNGSMATGKWHFLALCNNDTTVTFYVDNVLAASQPASPSQHSVGNFYFGTLDGTQYFFQGTIDDIRLYNRGLSSAEISSIYNAPVCAAPKPTATALNICGSGVDTLTASGGTNYNWYATATSNTLLGTGAKFVTPTLTHTTKYFVSNNNGVCESVRDTVTVNVLPLPKVSAMAIPQTRCIGTDITLKGNGAKYYKWSNGVVDNVKFKVDSARTYMVIGTDSFGCSNTAFIATYNLPNPQVLNSTPNCVGSPLTLTINSNFKSYNWTGPNGFTASVKNPLVTNKVSLNDSGLYVITVSDSNGCINSTTYQPVIRSLPVAVAKSLISPVCGSGVDTLIGFGGVGFKWFNSNTTSVSVGTSSIFITPYLSQSKWYYLVANDGVCESLRDSILVNVSPLPKVGIMSNSNARCVGNSIILNGTGAKQYVWTGGIKDSVSFVVSNPQTYTLTGVDTMGCSNTATISTYALPQPLIKADSAFCVGSPLSFNLPGTFSTVKWTGPNGFTAQGVHPVVSQALSQLDSGMYVVTVTDSNNCANTDSVNPLLIPLPLISISSSSNAICSGNGITLKAHGAKAYAWSGNIKDSVSFVPTQSTTYTVVGTDAYGCSSSKSINVVVNPLPLVAPICMVSVDDSSKHNLIVWEKPVAAAIDSFIIYREILTNNFQRIGSLPYTALSEFVDTVKTKFFPFTGDPNAGTYRYKIAVRDTCGNVSDLSPYHNTIYVSQNGGTFSWNQYEIEGQPVPIPSLSAYLLYRDNNGDGNWSLVTGVAGSQTTVTDANYLNYPHARWRVETQWGVSCIPTAKMRVVATNSSKSNISGHIGSPTGIAPLNSNTSGANTFTMLPNPAKNDLNLIFDRDYGISKLTIVDLLGQVVISSEIQPVANNAIHINIAALPTGVYAVTIENGANRTSKRLIVN